MNKNVLLKIVSTQWTDSGDDNRTVYETEAEFYDKGDSKYVIFTEQLEGISTPLDSRIKIKDRTFELLRKGELNTRLVLELGVKNVMNYETPYGAMKLEASVRFLSVEEKEDSLRINIEYVLSENNNTVTNNKLEITLNSVVEECPVS